MIKNNELVVKSNEVIQKKQIENMNITQLKIMNLIISNIDNNLTIENLCENDLIFEFDKNTIETKLNDIWVNFDRFKRQMKDLSKKQMEKYDGKDFEFVNIFSSLAYRKGKIEGKLNIDCIRYFINLKTNFTKYYFDNIARFKSKYSILFYELIKSDYFKKQRQVEYNLEFLFDRLKIEKKSMKIWNNFKMKVLNIVESEINDTSDLYFEYETIKKSRKITGIKVQIHNWDSQCNVYRSKRELINHIRTNYINQAIMIVNYKNNEHQLSVNEKGYLYFLTNRDRIDKEYSEKIWNTIFENQHKMLKYTKSLFE